MSTFEITGLPEQLVSQNAEPITTNPQQPPTHQNGEINPLAAGGILLGTVVIGTLLRRVISTPSPKFDEAHDAATLSYASRKSNR